MHYARQGDEDLESQQQQQEQQQDASSWRDDLGTSFKESCTSLSYEKRLRGFVICGCAGVVLFVLAVVWCVRACL